MSQLNPWILRVGGDTKSVTKERPFVKTQDLTAKAKASIKDACLMPLLCSTPELTSTLNVLTRGPKVSMAWRTLRGVKPPETIKCTSKA
jgi:hypothetical protein